MKLFRSKSILHLIMMGFAVVALPLIVALLYAAASVDKLAVQSQQMISNAVKATEGGGVLVEQMTAMERNLRQYQILNDELLLQVYHSNRKKFVETIGALNKLSLPVSLRDQLGQLTLDEAAFYKIILEKQNSLNKINVSDTFSVLSAQAQAILLQSQRLIDTEVANTQISAQEAQQNLFWQASMLVPGVLLLVAIIVALINRPLRRMDGAIRRLGAGDFSVALNLEGPRDIEQLGERLDWMRTRLMEVDQEKKRFLRHISHELKTPLTTIREGSELLAEEIPGELSTQQREIVELLRQNSVQLQKLIEDLLNYNSATYSPTLNLQTLRLDELVMKLIDEYKLTVMSRRLWFDAELAEITISADPEKIRIIIDNLLSNAVKFSPTKGKIKIKLGCESGYAVLTVQDQGPGIAREQRDRIFDAFYQGSANYTGHVSGTGLGLSIVKEYLHAHGGTIDVVNDGDVGASMRVCLPLRQELAAA